MARYDCGGYLNIVTDERDLTQVNVTLTHAKAHPRYADRPEDVPLEETPWLLDTGGLEDHSNMMGVEGQGTGNALDIGSSRVPGLRHIPSGATALQGSPTMNTALRHNSASIAIDPALQVATQPAVPTQTPGPSSFPYPNGSTSATAAALPFIMPLSTSSTSTAPDITINQALPTTPHTAANGTGTGPQIATSSTLAAPAHDQGLVMGNAGGDRVSVSFVRSADFR
jgi:hypothetical protein